MKTVNYTFLFLCLFLIFSCQKKPEKQQNPVTNIKTGNGISAIKIPEDFIKNSIITHETEDGFFRIFVESNETRGKYFYADTLNVLKTENYVFKNNQFIKTKSNILDEGEWNYLEIDSANLYTKKINGKDFQLISAKSSFQGKAVPNQNVHFWMVNIRNVSENYSLLYSGYPNNLCNECIKGDFETNEKLKKNSSAKKALYDFAKKSKLIYQKSNAEKKASHYKNFREKWQEDNRVDSNYGAGYEGEMNEIFSTYYKENLFEISGGSETEIENENYLIKSYFRSDVIGFDKRKKMYFPIIVESCAHFCNKNIEFTNQNTIKITYEDDTSWELELPKIQFLK